MEFKIVLRRGFNAKARRNRFSSIGNSGRDSSENRRRTGDSNSPSLWSTAAVRRSFINRQSVIVRNESAPIRWVEQASDLANT
jgi:hypothetical protein